jgi:hypothetical protein
MVSPHANTHAHDHEWRPPADDSAFNYEDGALHIRERCDYVEQRSAGTSQRLDETFYETVYECGARRVHRFDLSEIRAWNREDGSYTLIADAETVFDMDGVEDVLLEQIEQRAAERLTETTDGDEPMALEWFHYDGVDTGTHEFLVEVGDTDYLLTYRHTEVTRLD